MLTVLGELLQEHPSCVPHVASIMASVHARKIGHRDMFQIIMTAAEKENCVENLGRYLQAVSTSRMYLI